MEDGTYRSLIQATDPDLRVGDRVRIDNCVVRRYCSRHGPGHPAPVFVSRQTASAILPIL
jgi:hypothetical protein